jgi:AraC-like DNA-binding protein/quercetin dioxygenase-like cupin family protein
MPLPLSRQRLKEPRPPRRPRRSRKTGKARKEPALPAGRVLAPEPAASGRLLESLLASVSCSVLRAGWFPCAPDWSLPQRVMPNYILWVCVGGGADFRIGGEAYRLQAGSVLLAPPHVPQAGSHDPADPLRVYAIHFAARLYGVLDVPAVFRLPVTLLLTAERFEAIVEAAHQIVGELARAETGFVLAANGDCARLLALIWRESASLPGSLALRPPLAARASPAGAAARLHHGSAHGAHRAHRGAAAVARLAPVFRAVQARYAEPLTLEELAGTVHLHPAYFSTLFKRVTGLPPLRYLARYRLDRVRELLLSTDLTVSEIAAMTGYCDPFYLSRVFHQAEGVAPTEYRRAKKNPALP